MPCIPFGLVTSMALLAAGPSPGEVEFEIHTGFSTICTWPEKPATFPVLIEVLDADGAPVAGAIVALKRLGPDGWTEAEIRRDHHQSITDSHGWITIPYPRQVTGHDGEGRAEIAMLGAVTVIADGHPATTFELRDHFKDGHHTLVPGSAPHIRIAFGREDQVRPHPASGPADDTTHPPPAPSSARPPRNR